MRSFSDTVIDLKKALDAEELEFAALRAAFRSIDAIAEVRNCSKWPSTFVTVSRRWEQWSGLREFDVIGKSDYDYRPRKMADGLTLLLKEVIGAGRTLSYLSRPGNEASGFKPVRFLLTPFRINKSDFVVSIGMPVTSGAHA